ncbi:hypothetical protein [Mesorhizobium sp. M0768]|uniref:hypothetical protein n=1 Tax=Mesorhizobium sp. M0768 TaxID=2956996 RepID=UPI003339A0E6
MIGIERMCRLAGVSRAGYYRHWQVSSPRREETGLRDVIHRLALSNPHYGYRRIAVLLGRESWRANHKRGAAADVRGQSVVSVQGRFRADDDGLNEGAAAAFSARVCGRRFCFEGLRLLKRNLENRR